MASGGHPLPGPRGLRGHQHHRPGHPLGGRDLRRRRPVLDSEGRGGGHLPLRRRRRPPHRRGHQAQRRGGLLHHRRPPGRPQRGRHHSNGGPAAERAGLHQRHPLRRRRVHHHGVHLPGLWLLLHHQQALGRHPPGGEQRRVPSLEPQPHQPARLPLCDP